MTTVWIPDAPPTLGGFLTPAPLPAPVLPLLAGLLAVAYLAGGDPFTVYRNWNAAGPGYGSPWFLLTLLFAATGPSILRPDCAATCLSGTQHLWMAVAMGLLGAVAAAAGLRAAGPAWAWLLPNRSSRPTAAASPCRTATAAGCGSA